MKYLKKAVLAGLLVGLVCAGEALCADGFSFSIGEWITPNPPQVSELKGNVCVIEFWATWCGPCVKMLPHMMELAKKYEDRNVVFIGLSQDDAAQKVKAFVKQKNVNYNIAMDAGSADKLGVQGLPTAIIINHKGEIVWGGHPGSRDFVFELAKAVEAAPKPLLEGVDLGVLRHMRLALCGGKLFVPAYQKLQAKATSKDSLGEKAANVQSIVDTRITARIEAAEILVKTDAKRALAAYADIVERFGGIKVTAAAEKRYAQLLDESKKTIAEVAVK